MAAGIEVGSVVGVSTVTRDLGRVGDQRLFEVTCARCGKPQVRGERDLKKRVRRSVPVTCGDCIRAARSMGGDKAIRIRERWTLGLGIYTNAETTRLMQDIWDDLVREFGDVEREVVDPDSLSMEAFLVHEPSTLPWYSGDAIAAAPMELAGKHARVSRCLACGQRMVWIPAKDGHCFCGATCRAAWEANFEAERRKEKLDAQFKTYHEKMRAEARALRLQRERELATRELALRRRNEGRVWFIDGVDGFGHSGGVLVIGLSEEDACDVVYGAWHYAQLGNVIRVPDYLESVVEGRVGKWMSEEEVTSLTGALRAAAAAKRGKGRRRGRGRGLPERGLH